MSLIPAEGFSIKCAAVGFVAVDPGVDDDDVVVVVEVRFQGCFWTTCYITSVEKTEKKSYVDIIYGVDGSKKKQQQQM